MNEVAITKGQKAKKWLNDHTVEILMGFLLAGGTAAGIIIGKDIGYAKGLSEFRKHHCELAKMILDDAGQHGAFLALNHVRSDGKVYKQLLENPDGVLNDVAKLFYDSDYTKVMLASVEK